MGEFIGLPQLVQQLLLIQGRGHLFLLQAGHLPADGQQLPVFLLSLPGGLDPLALQGQLLLVQSGDLPLLLLILPGQLLELTLLLLDLPGEALVFLLIVPDQRPALVLVAGQIPAQALQLLQPAGGGLPLRLQGGQPRRELGELLGQGQQPRLQIALAPGLAIRLALQGGGLPLQFPDPVPGVLGVPLDLTGAALELPQLAALVLPLLF